MVTTKTRTAGTERFIASAFAHANGSAVMAAAIAGGAENSDLSIFRSMPRAQLALAALQAAAEDLPQFNALELEWGRYVNGAEEPDTSCRSYCQRIDRKLDLRQQRRWIMEADRLLLLARAARDRIAVHPQDQAVDRFGAERALTALAHREYRRLHHRIAGRRLDQVLAVGVAQGLTMANEAVTVPGDDGELCF